MSLTSNANRGSESCNWNPFSPEEQNYKQVPTYVHPLDRSSHYCLSRNSLEMCTENLGNETGSIYYSSFDEFSTSTMQDISSAKHRQRNKTRQIRNKSEQSTHFPPPLSSISGKNGVQVKCHREGGRLVIKSFSFSLLTTSFRAIRENGRLRLTFHKCESEERECVDYSSGNDEDDEKGTDCDGIRGLKLRNGERSGSKIVLGCKSDCKKLPNLPFCVAISS